MIKISSRYYLFALLIIPFRAVLSQAVDDFDKYTTVNQLGLGITNFGVLGNGYNLINGKIQPSAQYKQHSEIIREQVEHFSYAGLWVGGLVSGQPRVSTAIVDGVFESGSEGFEFRPLEPVSIRSSISSTSQDPMAAYYSPYAVSHQDYLTRYTDIFPEGEGIPNHTPLGIEVVQRSYAWNSSFADAFVILEYTIYNVSGETISNLYAGIWVDASVANMNYTSIYEPGGGYTWYDNLNGFDTSIDETGFPRDISYQYDADGDDGWAESYIGFTMLGGSVPRRYVNSFYNQWVWTNASNINYPDYDMALNDVERYQQLSNHVPKGNPDTDPDFYGPDGYPNRPNIWLLLHSAGPFGSVPSADSLTWELLPSDSVKVVFAVVAARWNGSGDDSPKRKKNLWTHADRAQRVFHGEDRNRNNLLDDGEDIDGDGELDRYILPPDPPNNLAAEWNYPSVRLSWSPPAQSVVGYNVYRSQNKGEFIQINTAIDTATIFVDETVYVDSITAYYVTSIDGQGIESVPSKVVKDWSSPPSIAFVHRSNPTVSDPDIVHKTFPTRTFVWEVADPDGYETVTNIYYSLDDTTEWIELPNIQHSITLRDIPIGTHIFYLKAKDDFGLFSPVAMFPDTLDNTTPNTWEVLPVTGNVLIVDDYDQDYSNNALNWYRGVLDSIPGIGPGNYSIWEIGTELPYSATDITSTLKYFDNVLWFTAYVGSETYHGADSNILSYVMDGGNLFINATELLDTSFTWFPMDSSFILNPTGRLLSGRTLESSISPDLDLQTSSLISVRVSGFVPDHQRFATVKEFYRMAAPTTGDGWTGNPTVCSMGQFQVSPTQLSGKIVLMSMPLHSGLTPLLEGNGSASKFIKYLLEEEFTLDIDDNRLSVPIQFHLYQNYPNPFNPSSTILFDLPLTTDVKLVIYNLLGQEVVRLKEEIMKEGYYRIVWDGRNAAGEHVPSGIYFARLFIPPSAGVTPEYAKSIKMVLLK